MSSLLQRLISGAKLSTSQQCHPLIKLRSTKYCTAILHLVWVITEQSARQTFRCGYGFL
jgi:hypothetical protein